MLSHRLSAARVIRQAFLQQAPLNQVGKRRHGGGFSTLAGQMAIGHRLEATISTFRQRGLSFPKRKPFAFNLCLNSCLCMGADLAAQSLEQGNVDAHRTAGFFGFGLLSGAVSYFVYVSVFGRLFPHAKRFSSASLAAKTQDRKGQLAVVKQVFADVLVYTPFIYFPNFYLFKSAMRADSESSFSTLAANAADSYQQVWKEDNLINCSIWAPAGIVLFSVPAWVRMPAMTSLNFLHTMLLSSMRGGGHSTLNSHAHDMEDDMACLVQPQPCYISTGADRKCQS